VVTIVSQSLFMAMIIGSLFSILFVSTLYLPGRNIYGISDLKIFTVGNWGCTSNSQATINNITSKNPDLVLGLGDYSYESTSDCWFNEIKPFDSKMKISIGNHDVMNNKLLNSYLDHFGLSKQYYSFDFQSVHVVTMATELELEAGSEQYNFVKNDLERVSKDPNIKWIIVTMHKPIYTSPNGCSASSCEGSKMLSDTYHPLFDTYGVDLVLQAHMHSYQRSFPIKYNAQDSSQPIITSSNKNNYNDPSGVIFAVVATGGINFHSLSGKARFTASQQDDNFGALELAITNNGNTIVGKFHANNGKVTDEFSVAKTSQKVASSHKSVPSATQTADKGKEVKDTSAMKQIKVSPPVKQSKDTPLKQSKDTPVKQSKDTPLKQSKDTPVKQSKDTPVKQSKDTPVKQSKDNTPSSSASVSRSEIEQSNSPQTEIHISNPDYESEEKEADSKTADTTSYKKFGEPKDKLIDPFAPSS
jgi:Calcineurin-like phosphoesterase